MSTLGVFFMIALAVSVAALQAQALLRARRMARLKGLELRPNCLLTRHPIAFLSKPRSLFRLIDRWDDVPIYLREHGYEVLIIEVPTRPLDVTASVLAALDSMSERCHLIADLTHEGILTAVAKAKHPRVASLTLVTDRERRSEALQRPSIDDLKPLASAVEQFEVAPSFSPLRKGKQFWFESRVLELAISLAERDAMLSD